MENNIAIIDCIIIGAGPAGLTAGIYLKRFRRNIVMIDNNQSRAELIPLSHNYPGFPQGISGEQLLASLRQQFMQYGGVITSGTVSRISQTENGVFIIDTGQVKVSAKNIILATGVIDIEPVLPDVEHAVKKGLIRHCMICDGYEVIDQKIGVIGYGKKGLQEAIFLSTYTSDITLLTLGEETAFTEAELDKLKMANISIISEPVIKISLLNDKIDLLQTKSGKRYYFDTIYSALGAKIRSDIAIQLGAEHLDNHCLIVDDHQQTTIPGLYAAGDIVTGLNQICVATGQGAIAASAIHNKILMANTWG